MKRHFKYEEGSQTIRLMPENYLVAFYNFGYFVIDPDSAIPDTLASSIFIKLRIHDLKFGKPDIVASILSSTIKLTQAKKL